MAGFIGSQPESWLPAEVSALSQNKGHLPLRAGGWERSALTMGICLPKGTASQAG